MLQLINLIKLRQQQLIDHQPFDSKAEKDRINQENQLLQILYRYQRVSIEEKINFYELSAQLMNKIAQPVLPILIYDQIAKLYSEFFNEQQFQDKALKIQLILENDMHKNQSFIILMLKWLLEFYRTKYQPPNPSKLIIRKRIFMTIDQNRIEVKRSSESQTKRIKMLNLSKSPESDSNNNNNQQSTLRKNRIYTKQLYNVISDVDWESSWEKSYKLIQHRNNRISRSIQKHLIDYKNFN